MMENVTRNKLDIVLVIIFLVAAALFAGYSVQIGINKVPPEENNVTFNNVKATIIQPPSCNCCENYKAYLTEQGLAIETTYTWDMVSVREQYQIPENKTSCHTAVIDGYFVEGHVPVKAIKKLLDDKPGIDGISLPGMPSGSPGMPGEMTEAFTIYALSDGKSSEFMTIGE